MGCLWAGDSEATRCGSELAYAFDLLTGGGQYSYLDWRLWPEKFPYASGVSADEVLFVETFNRAQHYFGMYESEPSYCMTSADRFSATAPNTYATIYHNRVWNEAFVVVANTGNEAAETSVKFNEPLLEPVAGEGRLAVYDVHERTARVAPGNTVINAFDAIALAPNRTRLFYVREVPAYPIYHQWGGKRITEEWDGAAHVLTVSLHGPATLTDRVVFATGNTGIAKVTVNGAPAEFFVEPRRGVVHGDVTFEREPVEVVVRCAADGSNGLPQKTLPPDQLHAYYAAR
jgi:hypothetical protein